MKIKTADIVTFAVIFILVSSILGLYTFKDDQKGQIPENAFYYQDYLVYEDQDGFFTMIFLLTNNQQIPVQFRLDPRELSTISIDRGTVNLVQNADKIYTTFNPNEKQVGKIQVAVLEVSRLISLVNAKGPSIIESFSEDTNPITLDIPLRTCTDSTAEELVIQFEIGNTNEIVKISDCVKVIGKDNDALINSADRLGYALVGIY